MITPNQTFTLNSPIASQTAQPWAVEFSNYSGLTITVITGFGQLLIPPYTVNTVSDPTGEFPPIMTLQTANSPLGVSPNASQSYLQAVWVSYPDSFTGQYPHPTLALPASSSSPSLIPQIQYQQNINGNTLVTPTLDVSNFQSLGLTVDNTDGPTTGHIEIVVWWQESTGIHTFYSEVFYFTGGLKSAFIIPVKGPMVFLEIIAAPGNLAISFISINGYTTPVPNIITIEAAGLPFVFFEFNEAIASGANNGLVLPSYDCFGPVTVSGAMGGLSVSAMGAVLLQIADYDHNDAQQALAQFPIIPTNDGAWIPFTWWLSRYRHKVTIFNNSSVAINAYLNIYPNI